MRDVPRRPATVAYDRVAAVYDWYTTPMETLGGRQARRRLFARARGRVLELGVGTGLNLSAYPPAVAVTGVDISAG
ncbi:class I SAM-dependent methyltransferase [Krasilnikovia cinnamomea]|uniref:class I SAM-dependent methyltransferase n=1 Tax=Krasilnikovia cinnamomea TaxID=349313 RepID=UPI00102CE2E6|nr:class I SAM-dependent methyltransferase [Krasilnikovia cinnamomea]